MSISTHPVQLHIDRIARVSRVQVVIRAVLVLALGLVAWSTIYCLLYLALPALIAVDLIQRGGDSFHERDAPRAIRALRWLAGAEAYLCFLSDVLPTSLGSPVDLRVNLTGAPSVRSALLRLVLSLPALALVALLTMASSIAWLVVAVWGLLSQRVPRVFADLMTFTLRVRFRFIAYHLSLVDRYPVFDDHRVNQPSPAAA